MRVGRSIPGNRNPNRRPLKARPNRAPRAGRVARAPKIRAARNAPPPPSIDSTTPSWSQWLDPQSRPGSSPERPLNNALIFLEAHGPAGNTLARALKADLAARRSIRARMGACTTG